MEALQGAVGALTAIGRLPLTELISGISIRKPLDRSQLTRSVAFLAMFLILAHVSPASAQNYYAQQAAARTTAGPVNTTVAHQPISSGRLTVAALDRAPVELPTPQTSPAGQFRGSEYITTNFRVSANHPQLAKSVGDAAESFRLELANRWLGRTLPNWNQQCPIQVIVTRQARGETSFLLPEVGQGEPTEWNMVIEGPVDRLLDSVLPHEITHTIMASHFQQRLPRWVDEGACTTVEHTSEKQKIHQMLLDYLSPQQRRGLPFNRMFVLREYPADPNDMLALYAQGYSVSKFLIAQGGNQHFTSFIQSGLANEQVSQGIPAWTRAVQKHYGYQDLSELQTEWLRWVQNGSDVSMLTARVQRDQTRVANGPAAESATMLTSTPATAAPSPYPSPRGTQESVAKANSSDNYYFQQAGQRSQPRPAVLNEPAITAIPNRAAATANSAAYMPAQPEPASVPRSALASPFPVQPVPVQGNVPRPESLREDSTIQPALKPIRPESYGTIYR